MKNHYFGFVAVLISLILFIAACNNTQTIKVRVCNETGNADSIGIIISANGKVVFNQKLVGEDYPIDSADLQYSFGITTYTEEPETM